MYIALNGTLVARRLDWPEFARIAHSVGYPGVDLLHNEVFDMGPAKVTDILKQHNLKPAVVALPVDFRKDDATFDAGMAKLPAAAAFARAIGCPRMSTWVPSWCEVPQTDQIKIWRKRFQAVNAILAQHNVRLGLEYLGPLHLRTRGPHPFLYKHTDMLEFAKSCGPQIGLLVDSWHWHHGNNTLADITATPLADLVHVQAADAPNIAPEKILDSERLMPGEGIIDFTAFFGALKKAGYRDAVSPEVFGRGLKDMPPEQGATLGLDTTTKVMKKAGVL
ncbi:MAG: sugar phosphate isomerase/epimerase [Acidobacteria bacterium]|nr:sugar phosphate isomerase/epimerase [Acidobacteriota bacterium]